MVLQRDRLCALLDERLPGALWLHGPTGSGKTVLLRSYLQRDARPSLWLTVDERHRDPAALFAAFGAAATGIGGALPAFSPEHRDEPRAFAAGWFARLDQLLPPDCAVVVDDAHHLAGATSPLLAAAIDAFGQRRVLCFASQLLPDAAFAAALAGSRLWTIGHRLLAFDEDEARALARRLGGEASALQALVAATDGWAAGLMLAMQLGGPTGANGSDDPLESVRAPLALLIAGHVLGGVSKPDLAKLRLLAELPQVPMALCDVAPAWASACARLQALSERGLFVERLVADRRHAAHDAATNVTRIAKGCWRLHDLFRNALREPGAIGEPDVALAGELATQLLAVERLDLAWQLAAQLDTALLASVVALHGGAALRSPHVMPLLPITARHANRRAPSIAVWMARALLGHDNAEALRCCDEAYAGYAASDDAEGRALSVALAFFVIFATIENVGAMAVWAERWAGVPAFSGTVIDDDEALAIRVAGRVVHDLLIGGADPDDDASMQDRLTALVVDEVLSANETMLAASLLVASMRRAMRTDDAESNDRSRRSVAVVPIVGPAPAGELERRERLPLHACRCRGARATLLRRGAGDRRGEYVGAAADRRVDRPRSPRIRRGRSRRGRIDDRRARTDRVGPHRSTRRTRAASQVPAAGVDRGPGASAVDARARRRSAERRGLSANVERPVRSGPHPAVVRDPRCRRRAATRGRRRAPRIRSRWPTRRADQRAASRARRAGLRSPGRDRAVARRISPKRKRAVRSRSCNSCPVSSPSSQRLRCARTSVRSSQPTSSASADSRRPRTRRRTGHGP